jgi:hypothetical protein
MGSRHDLSVLASVCSGGIGESSSSLTMRKK